MPNSLLDNLLVQLNGTGLQNKDKLDRQDNKKLYDFLRRLLGGTEQVSARVAVIEGSSSGGGSGTDISGEDFLTSSDESAVLPNSRELLAGTNVAFDDTVANERTINVPDSVSQDFVVMSDGATPPSPMNDGGGNFIYVPYTP